MYRIYVIELEDEAGPNGTRRNPDFPCVYVGQSWHPPEKRFAQHKAGIRPSRYVRKYGIQLLPLLYEHLNGFATQGEAKRAEKKLANKLNHRGYTVRGGH